jgi:hypothetical protein
MTVERTPEPMKDTKPLNLRAETLTSVGARSFLFVPDDMKSGYSENRELLKLDAERVAEYAELLAPSGLLVDLRRTGCRSFPSLISGEEECKKVVGELFSIPTIRLYSYAERQYKSRGLPLSPMLREFAIKVPAWDNETRLAYGVMFTTAELDGLTLDLPIIGDGTFYGSPEIEGRLSVIDRGRELYRDCRAVEIAESPSVRFDSDLGAYMIEAEVLVPLADTQFDGSEWTPEAILAREA